MRKAIYFHDLVTRLGGGLWDSVTLLWSSRGGQYGKISLNFVDIYVITMHNIYHSSHFLLNILQTYSSHILKSL